MECADPDLGSYVLSLLETGKPGDESYDTGLYVENLLKCMHSIDHAAYEDMLHKVHDQCCQHGENASCDVPRCSWHVAQFLRVEQRNLCAYLEICFRMGLMNTVPKMHLIFVDMAKSIYRKSFVLCDLYGDDEFKRGWALKQARSMYRITLYIIKRWDRRTAVEWLQSADEFQCGEDYSKGTYHRIVAEMVGIKLTDELGVECALHNLSLATK